MSIGNARKLNCLKISLEKGDTRSELKCAKLERLLISQPTITCFKLTLETLDQGIKHVQSYQ